MLVSAHFLKEKIVSSSFISSDHTLEKEAWIFIDCRLKQLRLGDVFQLNLPADHV